MAADVEAYVSDKSGSWISKEGLLAYLRRMRWAAAKGELSPELKAAMINDLTTKWIKNQSTFQMANWGKAQVHDKAWMKERDKTCYS